MVGEKELEIAEGKKKSGKIFQKFVRAHSLSTLSSYIPHRVPIELGMGRDGQRNLRVHKNSDGVQLRRDDPRDLGFCEKATSQQNANKALKRKRTNNAKARQVYKVGIILYIQLCNRFIHIVPNGIIRMTRWSRNWSGLPK